MPASIAVVGGIVVLIAALVLLGQALRLQRRLTATTRALHRARVAVAEIERVQHARDEVLGSADDADPIRRSYDTIAGVPFAVLEASPMPRETVRLLRDAHGVVAHSLYSTLRNTGRAFGTSLFETGGTAGTAGTVGTGHRPGREHDTDPNAGGVGEAGETGEGGDTSTQR